MPQEPLNVMVTGGTGFVGFHTVRALVSAGHSVRLLVRNPGKMRRVLGLRIYPGLRAISPMRHQ